MQSPVKYCFWWVFVVVVFPSFPGCKKVAVLILLCDWAIIHRHKRVGGVGLLSIMYFTNLLAYLEDTTWFLLIRDGKCKVKSPALFQHWSLSVFLEEQRKALIFLFARCCQKYKAVQTPHRKIPTRWSQTWDLIAVREPPCYPKIEKLAVH